MANGEGTCVVQVRDVSRFGAGVAVLLAVMRADLEEKGKPQGYILKELSQMTGLNRGEVIQAVQFLRRTDMGAVVEGVQLQ